MRREDADRVLQAPGAVTVREADGFAAALDAALDGTGPVVLDLAHVEAVDVVGLAMLVQAAARAAARGVALTVIPSPAVYHTFVEAQVLEAIPLAQGVTPSAAPLDTAPAVESKRTEPVAATPDFSLRPPDGGDLELFDRWAREPLLIKMVGSSLLYRCAHLGARDRVFARETLCSPTALTLLVETTESPPRALGFMRVFGIDLVQGYGFLEAAITSVDALRKGVGVRASRLLVAYTWDVLELRRIEARVYEYNRLSLNSLKRNGFRQEGVLRKAARAEGYHWDIHVFSILEEEMREQRRREQFASMSLWPR